MDVENHPTGRRFNGRHERHVVGAKRWIHLFIQHQRFAQWVAVERHVLTDDPEGKAPRRRHELRILEVHRAAEAEVETTPHPIHRVELATGFLPDTKTVELDVVFNDQLHVRGGPLRDGHTEVILNRDHGFCAAFIVP